MYELLMDFAMPNWTNNAEENLLFLRRVKAEARYALADKGYLTLDTVYKLLGANLFRAAPSNVGWLTGDIVDFGIYNVANPGSRRFVNGLEYDVWLRFNAHIIDDYKTTKYLMNMKEE